MTAFRFTIQKIAENRIASFFVNVKTLDYRGERNVNPHLDGRYYIIFSPYGLYDMSFTKVRQYFYARFQLVNDTY